MVGGKGYRRQNKAAHIERKRPESPRNHTAGSGFGHFCVSGANRQLGSDKEVSVMPVCRNTSRENGRSFVLSVAGRNTTSFAGNAKGAASRALSTCPLREEKSFSQRAFSICTDIRKLQDKSKTSYTDSGSTWNTKEIASVKTRSRKPERAWYSLPDLRVQDTKSFFRRNRTFECEVSEMQECPYLKSRLLPQNP